MWRYGQANVSQRRRCQRPCKAGWSPQLSYSWPYLPIPIRSRMFVRAARHAGYDLASRWIGDLVIRRNRANCRKKRMEIVRPLALLENRRPRGRLAVRQISHPPDNRHASTGGAVRQYKATRRLDRLHERTCLLPRHAFARASKRESRSHALVHDGSRGQILPRWMRRFCNLGRATKRARRGARRWRCPARWPLAWSRD